MSVSVGLNQKLLSSGDKFYAYSGLKSGDATNPATVDLISIENIGLRDCYIQVQPFYSLPNSNANQEALGIQILIDDEIVFESKAFDPYMRDIQQPINQFVEKQSKVVVKSLNTSGNNGQSRGATLLGWYL